MLGFLRKWKTKSEELSVEPVVPASWRIHAGFAHPNWDANTGLKMDAGLAEGWLNHLARQAGPEFRLDRSRCFRLLSPFSARKAGYQIQFLESIRTRLVRRLGRGETPPGRPHVVILLRDPEEYWRYISHYTGGSSGGSVGMCVRAAYSHMVSYDSDVNQLQSTLAHELVHDLLSDLELPLWLEEGICQTFPEMVGVASSGLHGLEKDAPRLQALARRRGLREFWSGQGFSAEEEYQRLCYALAEILTRLILDRPHSSKFTQFLEKARRADCGQEACLEVFDTGLERILSDFLGPGEWEPHVSPVNALWALLQESRWESAIELAEASTPANLIERNLLRLGRGIALSETSRTAEAIAELRGVPKEFKSADVWVREFWLRLRSEQPDCEDILVHLKGQNYSVGSLRASWLYAQGKYAEALEQYRTSGNDEYDLALMGFAAWKLGDIPKAREHLARALSRGRGLVTLVLQAELELMDSDLVQAKLTLQDCLSLSSEDISTWELLGRLAELNGRIDAAQRAYSRCVEIFDRRGGAWAPERERVEFSRQRLVELPVPPKRGPTNEAEIGFDPFE